MADLDEIKHVINRLLEKTGQDPRLTPKIIRSKVESRMKLNSGDLWEKREFVKKVIIKWWKKKTASDLEAAAAIAESEVNIALTKLSRLAKAVGKGSGYFKELRDLDNSGKVVGMRKK
jgi:hypothetical protein